MAKVYLLVVGNENGKTIDIPIGKTTLGRGPLLGCADKKVSRNHAVLEVQSNGDIYLTPTHVNPCFYRTKSETALRVIKKDTAQKIEPGDIFSLLPNSFQYKVCSQSNDNKTDSSKPEDETVNSQKDAVNSTETSPVKDNKKENKDAVELDSEASPNKTLVATGLDKTLTSKDSNDKNSTKTDEIPLKTPVKAPNAKTPVTKTPSKESLDNSKKSTPKKAALNDRNEKKGKVVSNDTAPAAVEEPEDEPEDEEEDGDEDGDEEDGKEELEEEQESTSFSKKVGPSKTPQKPSQRPRKRTLPSWLLKSASVPRLKEETNGPYRKTPAKQTSPGDKSRQKNSRGSSEGNRSNSRSSRQNRQTIQRISLEDFVVSEEDWSSVDDEEEKRKNKRGRGGARQGRNDDSGSDWEFENRKQQTRWKGDGSSDSEWEMSGARRRRSKRFRESESGSDWETETKRKKPVVKKPTRGRRAKRAERDKEEEESAGDDSQSRPASQGSSRKREPCLFGKKCYRKNTSHFDVYSHPGDSDYTSPDEDRDNSDSKPECEKNAQHRSDFKHSKKVRPKREASKKAGKKSKKDEDDEPQDLSAEESDDYNPESDAS